MTFSPRLTKPEAGNKYYITKAKGGWSTAIVGNPTDPDCNVLHNCVGYAFGRYNEIIGDTKMTHLLPVNAENFYSVAISQGLKVGAEPQLGAVIVWEGIGSAADHVAVVEQIYDDGSILTSESGYKCKMLSGQQNVRKVMATGAQVMVINSQDLFTYLVMLQLLHQLLLVPLRKVCMAMM